MPPSRTQDGRWVLYHPVTGERVLRWPVDGVGMIARGDLLADPPGTVGEADQSTAPEDDDAPMEHALGGPLMASTADMATAGHALDAPVRKRGRPRKT